NNKTELRKFWWKGLYNCYLAALLFSLAFFLKKILPGWESQSFANILFQYGYFLLFLIASFNQLAGMSRMFGIDCPDPTHFLVLAKTPMETWQRGSTYLYRFFLRHIFIPLMRFSRHFALASLLSFVLVIGHMFLFQDIVVRGLFVQLVPELRAPPVNILSTVIFSFSWISIWYFWILIGASLWNRILRKFSHPICQWLSVIGNHLVVLSILPITNIYIVPFFLRTFISI
ncbi:MAG: hypothetical protein KDD35_12950, partial [Bdellovibrionales bacterium]|nr:hypothetical protein [Bdellovibrionales bacterium]